MTRDDAFEYARRWTEAWNSRDLDAVLDHFDEEVTFSSPKALEAVGAPTVPGKAALRKYWVTALQTVTSLRFTLLRVIWDPDSSELVDHLRPTRQTAPRSCVRGSSIWSQRWRCARRSLLWSSALTGI
jgi:ketosteroid isomerase-like protein